MRVRGCSPASRARSDCPSASSSRMHKKAPAAAEALSIESGGLLRSRLRLGVLAAEALNAPRGVNQLLLACEEGVAAGADFRVDIALVRRARGERVPTGANDANLVVVRMNSLLRHDSWFGPFLRSFYFSVNRRLGPECARYMDAHRLISSQDLRPAVRRRSRRRPDGRRLRGQAGRRLRRPWHGLLLRSARRWWPGSPYLRASFWSTDSSLRPPWSGSWIWKARWSKWLQDEGSTG